MPGRTCSNFVGQLVGRELEILPKHRLSDSAKSVNLIASDQYEELSKLMH